MKIDNGLAVESYLIMIIAALLAIKADLCHIIKGPSSLSEPIFIALAVFAAIAAWVVRLKSEKDDNDGDGGGEANGKEEVR